MIKNETQNEPEENHVQKSRPDFVRLVTLAGVFALMVNSLLILRLMDQASMGLNDRLNRIERQLENIAGKADTVAVKTPPRRDPDPDQVYEINTSGAPSKGSPVAKVTIVEFSDFQ